MGKLVLIAIVIFLATIGIYSGSIHAVIWVVIWSATLTFLFSLWVLVYEYGGKKMTMPTAAALIVLYAVALAVMIFSVLSVPPGGCIL